MGVEGVLLALVDSPKQFHYVTIGRWEKADDRIQILL